MTPKPARAGLLTVQRGGPPDGLPAECRQLWADITSRWHPTVEGLAILRVAVEARARMLQAQAQLDKDGLTFRTRQGGIRAHPCVRIRREAEGSFLMALRALGLETPR